MLVKQSGMFCHPVSCLGCVHLHDMGHYMGHADVSLCLFVCLFSMSPLECLPSSIVTSYKAAPPSGCFCHCQFRTNLYMGGH